MDDVEDDSHLRRGMPGALPLSLSLSLVPVHAHPQLTRDAHTVAHKIYGIPQTINSANYVYFLAFQALQRIRPRPGVKVEEMVTGASHSQALSPRRAGRADAPHLARADELLNLHRGQGMDLFWRENLICPTEPEYIDMVNNSASSCLARSRAASGTS